MLRILSLLIITLFLAACATTDNYRLALNSWRGANINQLVNVWGYPDKTSTAPDGNKLYIYRMEQRGTNPIYSTGPTTSITQNSGGMMVSTTSGTTSGGGSYDFNCTTWVEVDEHGTIVGTSFRGNNCVGTQDFLNTHANQN